MKTIVKGGDAVRTFTRRDGATAVLKKLGVKPSDYNAFVHQTTDGRYAVNVEKAQTFIESKHRLIGSKVAQGTNRGKTAAAAASNVVKRPTVSGTIRELIIKGLDNAAIHAIMVRDFGHDEEKKHYPGWYRSRMRADGLIPRGDVKRGRKPNPPKVTAPNKHGKGPRTNKKRKAA
jgi:hypothetical protein